MWFSRNINACDVTAFVPMFVNIKTHFYLIACFYAFMNCLPFPVVGVAIICLWRSYINFVVSFSLQNSERSRNKANAWSSWDYLQQYKAREKYCLCLILIRGFIGILIFKDDRMQLYAILFCLLFTMFNEWILTCRFYQHSPMMRLPKEVQITTKAKDSASKQTSIKYLYQ